MLTFADGSEMPFDDGKTKTFEQRLDNADAEDMMEHYIDHNGEPPAYLSDVGRTRCEALFKKMYGNTSAAVGKQLTTIDGFGQKLTAIGITTTRCTSNFARNISSNGNKKLVTKIGCRI